MLPKTPYITSHIKHKKSFPI